MARAFLLFPRRLLCPGFACLLPGPPTLHRAGAELGVGWGRLYWEMEVCGDPVPQAVWLGFSVTNYIPSEAPPGRGEPWGAGTACTIFSHQGEGFVFCSCCNRSPPTGWLKTTGSYCLSVLETRSQRTPEPCSLQRLQGRRPPSPSAVGGLPCPVAGGRISPVGLIFTWCLLCVSYKDTCCWMWGPLTLRSVTCSHLQRLFQTPVVVRLRI